jgi:Lrp/AsnC family transcriptional regulator
MLVAAPGDGVANRWRKSLACATILLADRPGRTESFMDKLDARILDLLQANGELTAAEIAERVGLSKVPCWRRIQKLQQAGVIRQTVALLDAHALNVGTTVFVTLKTANHSEAWFAKFVRAVRDIPEVTEIHRMSGDVDYLIRIVVPDIDAYDAVYKRLISAVDFLDVSASFALETIKYTTALPLCYLKTE